MFYIVNNHDRPCKRLLCIINRAKLEYLDPHYKSYRAMGLEKATRLEDFGFQIDRITDSLFECTRTSEGTATYSDGTPRRWQGSNTFQLDLKDSTHMLLAANP